MKRAKSLFPAILRSVKFLQKSKNTLDTPETYMILYEHLFALHFIYSTN